MNIQNKNLMEKLQLSEIFTPLPFTINTGISMGNLKDFAENVYDETFDTDVFLPTKGINLQRPLVWTLQQKQEIVKSVLKEQTIPQLSCVIRKYGTGVLAPRTIEIIDGKQRFTSLIDFYHNRFPLHVNGNEYFYKDCDEKIQYRFNSYDLVWKCAYSYDYKIISDEWKIQWFYQINFAGTPQDQEHMNKLLNS